MCKECMEGLESQRAALEQMESDLTKHHEKWSEHDLLVLLIKITSMAARTLTFGILYHIGENVGAKHTKEDNFLM